MPSSAYWTPSPDSVTVDDVTGVVRRGTEVVVISPVGGGEVGSLLESLGRTDAAVVRWDATGAGPPPGAVVVVVVGPRCRAALLADPALAEQIEHVVTGWPTGRLLPVLVDGMATADLAGLPGGLGQLVSVQALCWDGTAATATRLEAVVANRCAARRGTTALSRLDEEFARLMEQRDAVTDEVDAVQRIVGRNIEDTFRLLE